MGVVGSCAAPLDVSILGKSTPGPLVLLALFLFVLFLLVARSMVREAITEYRRLVPHPSGTRTAREGVVGTGAPLVAPLSGRACAAWFVRVWAEGRGGNTPVRVERASVPFRLGPPESVQVELDDTFEFPERLPPAHRYRHVASAPVPPALRARLRTLDVYPELERPDRPPHELQEYAFEVGKIGSVTGIPVDREGTLLVRDATLAEGSLEDAARIHRRRLAWSVGVFLGAFLALPIALAAYAAWLRR